MLCLSIDDLYGCRGRPCGLLMAWLEASWMAANKAAHMRIAGENGVFPLDVRAAARGRLKSFTNSDILLSFEEPQQDDEQEEPAVSL